MPVNDCPQELLIKTIAEEIIGGRTGGKPHCHCHILESLDEQAAQQPTNVHLGEEDEVDGVRLCQQPHQRVVAVPPKQKSPEISVERKKLTHISLARLTLVLAKKPQPGLSSRVADLRMNS
ncbi:hypothetical protein OsI_05836 [Oryza sativa Indica Group]|uniref:Uncharacterized protein n=1 Tax=Oryza sativa subsp. indica TaxID=39946 RepID=B8AHQ7_ORYSI|nr:hypothetical protein OsI_05836 [Oryza sativa Indica Group]